MRYCEWTCKAETVACSNGAVYHEYRTRYMRWKDYDCDAQRDPFTFPITVRGRFICRYDILRSAQR